MLAGVIAAMAEAEGESGTLAAELPVAGQTLVEQQARLLAAAGASRVLLLVERAPDALVAAVDRLRRDGLTVDFAKGADDLADRVHPDELLLLMAPGLVTDRQAVDRLMEESAPAVLTLPDTPDNARWERIDASNRWAGVALIDGALLRNTVGMLGDWDIVSTLLRRAVQSGAAYAPLPNGAPLLGLVDSRPAAARVDEALASRRATDFASLPDRLFYAPLAAVAAPAALRGGLTPDWFRFGAIAATAVAAWAFVFGWFWSGLVMLVLAGLADSFGARLASLGHRSAAQMWHFDLLRLIATGAAALGLGWRLSREGGGWGSIALVIALFGFMAALAHHRRLFPDRKRPPLWLADLDSLILLYVPFALAGAWSLGLAALCAYALASLIVTQKNSAPKAQATGLARF